jgi:hypothetical protein
MVGVTYKLEVLSSFKVWFLEQIPASRAQLAQNKSYTQD